MTQSRSRFLLPGQSLASCIAAGILRDTRGTDLSDRERLNYFPATPLFALTCVISGELRMAQHLTDPENLRTAPPMPPLSVTPPKNTPVVSWSTGPVCAITLGIYPDAWRKLGGDVSGTKVPAGLETCLLALAGSKDQEAGWADFTAAFAPVWARHRQTGTLADWAGSDRISDWSRHIMTQIAISAPGRSARALERRLRSLAGQTKQSMEFYAKIERLYEVQSRDRTGALANIALDANYSDQSHMGRAVKRATGFSPARLNHLIKTEEAFWCYRLMGERF